MPKRKTTGGGSKAAKKMRILKPPLKPDALKQKKLENSKDV